MAEAAALEAAAALGGAAALEAAAARPDHGRDFVCSLCEAVKQVWILGFWISEKGKKRFQEGAWGIAKISQYT